jgi:hypothetical protein
VSGQGGGHSPTASSPTRGSALRISHNESPLATDKFEFLDRLEKTDLVFHNEEKPLQKKNTKDGLLKE